MGKMNDEKKGEKPKQENKTDWAFTPKLGHEIEPQLTEKELDDFLTRLVKPSPKPSGQEKKGTSA